MLQAQGLECLQEPQQQGRCCACSGHLPSNVSGAAANGTNFFPALRAMNISHNAFSGTLPAAFGQSGIFNLKPLQVCSTTPDCGLLEPHSLAAACQGFKRLLL